MDVLIKSKIISLQGNQRENSEDANTTSQHTFGSDSIIAQVVISLMLILIIFIKLID